jgi:hypothetical protein
MVGYSEIFVTGCETNPKRPDTSVLVAFTDKHEAVIYSLPYLQHMHTLSLPTPPDSYVLFALLKFSPHFEKKPHQHGSDG